MNLFLHGSEQQVLVIHERRIQEAMRANQLRQMRGHKPHGMIVALNNVRNFIALMLISAGEHVRQEPVRRPDLDAKPLKAARQA